MRTKLNNIPSTFRRTKLMCVMLMSTLACSKASAPPVPTDVVLSVAGTCREGSEIPVSGDPRDASGKSIPTNIDWTFEPPDSLAMESGKIKCRKEGTSKVTVKAGSVTKTISLVVESPLVGLWIRRGDAKSGLTLNVVQGTDGLSGYVVRPPDETSLPGLRSELRTKNVDAQFKCLQRTWGNGLKKWASMKRIGVDRWAMGDLAKPLTLSHCNPILRECSSVCIEGRSEYLNDYELTLTDTSHATIRRTTTTKGDPQQWERITEMPDGGAPTALQDAAPSLATSAGALSVPQPPEATSKPTPKASGSIRIRCKNGEKAYPYKLGCQCGEHDPTGDKAESIDMPGPCSYAAKGDGPYCVFPADCKYEK
ncbi:MAG: hypothetical protein KBF88_00265 [Polyangiaceae bacterium]|nr:hypothetical protein [Polyangiaceae bacterium]